MLLLLLCVSARFDCAPPTAKLFISPLNQEENQEEDQEDDAIVVGEGTTLWAGWIDSIALFPRLVLTTLLRAID